MQNPLISNRKNSKVPEMNARKGLQSIAIFSALQTLQQSQPGKAPRLSAAAVRQAKAAIGMGMGNDRGTTMKVRNSWMPGIIPQGLLETAIWRIEWKEHMIEWKAHMRLKLPRSTDEAEENPKSLANCCLFWNA